MMKKALAAQVSFLAESVNIRLLPDCKMQHVLQTKIRNPAPVGMYQCRHRRELSRANLGEVIPPQTAQSKDTANDLNTKYGKEKQSCCLMLFMSLEVAGRF